MRVFLGNGAKVGYNGGMIKINVLAVGSIKEKFFQEAIGEYAKRLKRFCSLNIVEVPEQSSLTIEKKIDAESNALMCHLRGYVILLDRQGKEVSSQELSGMIEELKSQGNGEITFVIGGSNGVNGQLIARADKVISFGKVTFPHQLFRVILLEQIYRAFTISEGLPYHK